MVRAWEGCGRDCAAVRPFGILRAREAEIELDGGSENCSRLFRNCEDKVRERSSLQILSCSSTL